MNEPDDLKKTDEPLRAKRPYEKPRLSVYGDLRLRTWTAGAGSRGDGGVHPNNRTG
jgi:hypothetical protein